MVDDICRLTAAALSAKLRDGEITAEQLARTWRVSRRARRMYAPGLMSIRMR